MKRLHSGLVMRFGEPSGWIIYDREMAVTPGRLPTVHVGVWDPDEDCDVTTFATVGMSEVLMKGADYRVELTLGHRGPMDDTTRSKMTVFLANLSEYPFTHDLKLDWWERLSHPGPIPGFPGCPKLLLAPPFGGVPLTFPAPDDDVRLLTAIPVTQEENDILATQGRDAFLDYWENAGVDIFAPRGESGAGAERSAAADEVCAHHDRRNPRG